MAAPKSSAQRQCEYKQRIAASGTPAQSIATRKSKTEKKRNKRLRQAANLALAIGSLESNNVRRRTSAAETAQIAVQPGTSSDQIEVQQAQTTKWASSTMRCKSTFLDNDFGYACSVCDRLWFKNDLKPITAAQLKLIVTAGSSASLQNNVPDQMPQLSPVIKNVKPELEPVEMKEDPPSEDQVSLDEEDQLSDVEDPCEDLIPLSNDQIPPTNAQDPLTEIKMEEPELTMDETKVKMEEVSEPDIVGTGSGLATMLVSPSEKQEDKELIFSQSQQIASLTARCSNRQQQLNDVVALLRERDKTISTLRAERDVLASYIAERGGTGADRIQIQSVNKTVEEKKRNRRIFFFKRLRKSRQKTSENGQKTSDNEQKISILKRAVNIREISDIVGKHSLNIVEKSSLGSEGESSILNDVQHASKIKKSSVGLPKTSEVLQKPSIVVKPISDTKNPLLVNQLNSNKRDISSGRVQRSSVIRQKQSITIKPISEIIKGPSLVIEPLAKKSKISSLDVQSSSENRQKTSLVVQPESDVRQISPVGLPRTLESQQNALVIQIDGMHNTVLQPTLVRLDKCSGNGVKGGKG